MNGVRIILFSLVALEGCASRYGYDYFNRPNWDNRHAAFVGEYIEARVGKYFDPKWCHPDGCVKEDLNDSSVLYKFTDNPNKGCTYWYETNKETHIVIRADFRGTKQQCYKLLN